MKMHTPFFIIGIIVAVASYIGLPGIYEDIVVSVLGIALMILSSTITHANKKEEVGLKEDEIDTAETFDSNENKTDILNQ